MEMSKENTKIKMKYVVCIDQMSKQDVKRLEWASIKHNKKEESVFAQFEIWEFWLYCLWVY